MTLFFILIISTYAGFVLLLLFGWERILDKDGKINVADQCISVVVPFRDEEDAITSLMTDMKAQTHSNFEIILVNDHSTDRSVQQIEALMKDFRNVQLISLADTQGKKAAITAGVAEAKGEIIVTTDADCGMSKGWLTQISRAYGDDSVKMVIGAVRVHEKKSFFAKVQALEMSSLVGTAGGTLGWGYPSMCNGANLSYRKLAFSELGGYEGNDEVASGDDEFLMRKFFGRWPSGIDFLRHREGVITTQAASTLGGFIQQRLRWAGKWKHNSSKSVKAMAVGVWLYHFTFLTFACLAYTEFLPARLFFYGMGAKIFAEALFLFLVARFLQLKWSWPTFFFVQFFYSLYVVSIGFASQWVTSVWKGRSITPRV